jgi:hypothetical protein
MEKYLSVHFYSPLASGAFPFAIDQKEEKVLSKSSFLPPLGFFFPAHIPEYPPKTVPAFAGPDYFDRPPAFHLPVNREPDSPDTFLVIASLCLKIFGPEPEMTSHHLWLTRQ